MINKSNRMKLIKVNRKIMCCALVFVLVAIVTMTIAYSALSTTLKINGTAEFQKVNWSFKIEESPYPSVLEENYYTISDNLALYGNAKLIKKPTISGMTISNYQVSLTTPGDEIFQLFKITNTGNLPATIDGVIWGGQEYTSSTNNQEDLEFIQQYYYNNIGFYEYIKTADGWEMGEQIYDGMLICPGATVGMMIYDSFDYYAEAVLKDEVTIVNHPITINLVAVDKDLCNGDEPVEQ